MSRQPGRSATPYYTPPTPPSSIRPQAQPPVGSSAAAVAPTGRWSQVGKLWEQARTTLRGQFVVLAVLILILSVTQALLVSQSFRRASDDLNNIYSGSSPSVDAAQAIAQYIDDIDAKSADYLATGGLTTQQPCTIPGKTSSISLTVHDCDDQTIDAEIIQANQQLFVAARNVTYPGEQTAIERITAGLEEYVSHVTVLRYEYDLATNPTASQQDKQIHLKNAYNAYKAANDVLLQKITRQPLTDTNGAPILQEQLGQPLPTCTPADSTTTLQPNEWATGNLQTAIDCLSDINKSHLEGAYLDTQNFLGQTIELTGLFCAVFCLLLFFVTGRMTYITHRVVNIGLTLALLIAIGFSIASVSFFAGMAGDTGSFKQMVRDSYDSVYAANLLKRYGTSANADESRWLIALKFNDQAAADRWQTDWQTNTQLVQQYMTKAKANQTYPEEIQPLSDMQDNWNQYFSIDGQIRNAATNTADANHLNAAETLSTGTSNTAFGAFEDAVDALGKANRDHYDSIYSSTNGALQVYILLSAILFPVIGLVAAWGVWQRLRDF